MNPPPALPATTVRNQRLDFSDWHKGRPRYVLWALQWDATGLARRMQAAQAHLAEFLLEGYCRQAHITLSLCGFPRTVPQRTDEFSAQQLQAQLAALREAQVQAFDIGIGALESFSSVPYFSVHAPPGVLQALRACLRCGEADAHGKDYTPHVTLGLYADAWPFEKVRQRIAEWHQQELEQELELEQEQEQEQEQPRARVFGRARVTGLDLLSYASAEIGGPLQLLGRYDFASARMQWNGSALFAA